MTIKEKAEAYAIEVCGDYYNRELNGLSENIGGFCVKDFTAGYEAGLRHAEEQIKILIEKESFFMGGVEGDSLEVIEKEDLINLTF